MRKLATVALYKNTPFVDINNTIHFKGFNDRDDFFNTHYSQKTLDKSYNFIREGGTLNVDTKSGDNELDWLWLQDVNYMRFYSSFDQRYIYCWVTRSEYINDKTTKLYLIVDGIMTYLQGDFTPSLRNVNVQRQHIPADEKQAYLPYLRTNTDTINTGQKYYTTWTLGYYFDKFVVVFRSSVDLTSPSDWGDENSPNVPGASGGQYDSVVGAQDLYCVEYEDFHNFMSQMKKFPWITRNFDKIQIIPQDMVNLSEDGHVKKLNIGGVSYWELVQSGGNILNNSDDRITVQGTQIYDLLKLPKDMPEMLRQEYGSITITGYNGQEIYLNPALLQGDELHIKSDASVGFQNEVRFYPLQYGLDHTDNPDPSKYKQGGYLDQSIIIKDFDTTPVVIDNGSLAVASNANQRRVSNEKTGLGAVQAMSNPQNSALDKFMIGASQTARWVGGAVAGVASGGAVGGAKAVGGMINDDYWHYREQNAQIQDQRIAAPTVTEMSTNNAFNIKHDIFGITIKFQVLSDKMIEEVKLYYKRFGYSFDFVDSVKSIESMTKLNYLRVTGAFQVSRWLNIPTPIFKQIQAQLETGVTFWHNPNNLENPFDDNLLDNTEV